MKLTDLGQESVRAYLDAFVGPPDPKAKDQQHSQTQLEEAFPAIGGKFPTSGRRLSDIIWKGASSPHLDELLNFIHGELRKSAREKRASFLASLPDSGWPLWLDERNLPTLALAQLREEVRPAAEYVSVLADASRARQWELLEQPFVGRTDDINQLKAHLTGKEGKIIVVHGPGGAGKSSLLARVAHRNNRWISRFISEAKEAFQRATWKDLEADLYDQLDGSTDDLRGFLRQDHRSPVTILIDGIDEAPETGVNKLWNERLGRNVTLILGVRADTPQELQSFLPINPEVNQVRYLPLGDLRQEDVEEWVQQWATGKRVDNIAELGRLIHQVTEGYPLFISMLLRESNPATMAAQLGQQINDAGQVTRGQGELPAAFVQYAFDCWSRVRTESYAWLIPAMAAARGPIHRSLLNRIRGGGSEISGLDTIAESIGRWFKRSIDGTLAWTHPRLGDVFRQVQTLQDTKAEREANLREILIQDVQQDAGNRLFNPEGEGQAGRYDAAHLVDHLITALENKKDVAVDQAALALASADFVVRWWQTVGLAAAMRQARRLRAAIRRHWPRHVPEIVNSLPAILESIGPAWEIGVRPLQAIANHSGQTELYVSARDRLDRLGEPWFHRTWPRELHESGVQLVMSGRVSSLYWDPHGEELYGVLGATLFRMDSETAPEALGVIGEVNAFLPYPRNSGVYIGTDHGLFWVGRNERAIKCGNLGSVDALCTDPSGDGVYAGTFEGLVWVENGSAPKPMDEVGPVETMIPDPSGAGVLVGSSDGLFRVENGKAPVALGDVGRVRNLIPHPGTVSAYLACDSGLFHLSGVDAPIRIGHVGKVHCHCFDYVLERVYLGTETGLYYITKGAQPIRIGNFGQVTAVLAESFGEELYVVNEGQLFIVKHNSEVVRVGSLNNVYFLTIDPEGNGLYAGDHEGMYRVKRDSDPILIGDLGEVTALLVDPLGIGIYAGSKQGLFRLDSGSDWSPRKDHGDVTGLLPTPWGNGAVIGTSEGLFVAENDRPIRSLGNVGYVFTLLSDANGIYVGSEKGLFHLNSTDTTLKQVASSVVRAVCLDPSDNGLYFGDQSGIHRVDEDFEPVPVVSISHVRSLVSDPGRAALYVVSAMGLHRYDCLSESLDIILDGQVTAIYSRPSYDELFIGAASTFSGLFKIEKAQKPQLLGGMPGLVCALCPDPSGPAFYVGTHTSLYRVEMGLEPVFLGDVPRVTNMCIDPSLAGTYVATRHGIYKVEGVNSPFPIERLNTDWARVDALLDYVGVSAGSRWGVYEWRHPDQG